MSGSAHIQQVEGFAQQRLTVLPANVVNRCRFLTIVKDLYLTDIGIYPSAPHHYVERELGCPQAILIYCLDGGGVLRMDNKVYKIQKGDAVLIPPNRPHLYRSDRSAPWSIFWVHFTGEQSEAMLKNMRTARQTPQLCIPDTGLMRDAFEDLYACLNYHYSDAGLLAMTSELIRLFSKMKLHQSAFQAQRKSAEGRTVGTIGFMQQHLDMSLTLGELAAHSGQSIPYYSKLFKERTNQSPMAYFIQLKVQKACELLDQTDLSIQEVAVKLGYDDPYYFSRIFKKVQGASPSIYRQSIKG
jgi:AraC family transcriptional regulator of arabinose operon